MIDTCATEARTRRFLAAVAAATEDQPVRLAAHTAGDLVTWLPERKCCSHRFFADARGTPFDILAAFVDAMEWNGGPFATQVCCAPRGPTAS